MIEIEDKTRECVSEDRIALATSPSGVIISLGARTEEEDENVAQGGYGQYGKTRLNILRHLLAKRCSMW